MSKIGNGGDMAEIKKEKFKNLIEEMNDAKTNKLSKSNPLNKFNTFKLPASKTSNPILNENNVSFIGDSKISQGKSSPCGDPVDIITGNFYIKQNDLIVNGQVPLAFTRFYNAMAKPSILSLGINTTHNYDIRLSFNNDTNYLVLTHSDGRQETFDPIADNIFKSSHDTTLITKTTSGYSCNLQGPISYSFNTKGQITSIKNDINKISLSYKNNLLYSINTKSASIQLSYSQNKISTITASNGQSVSYQYLHDKLISVTNVNGGKNTYHYDNDNQIIECRDPMGYLTVKNVYDQKGRVIQQTLPLDNKVYFDYDEVNRVNTFTDKNGSITRFYYDELGQLTRIHNNDTNQYNSYDPSNRLVNFVDKNCNDFSYDYYHNSHKMFDPLGNPTQIFFDDSGRIVKELFPDNTYNLYSYNTNGSLASFTDQRGMQTKYSYDDNLNLILITYPDNSFNSLSYDQFGNVTSFSHNDSIHYSMLYDQGNMLSKLTLPEGNSFSFKYNSINKLIKKINPDGSTISKSYDLRTFLTEEILEDGSKLTYNYDEAGNLISKSNPSGCYYYSYDSMGNITSIIAPSGSTSYYEYDIYSNLSKYTDELGNSSLYEYDLNQNLIKITYPDNTSVLFKYDPLNRLTSKINQLGAVTSFNYNYRGDLVCITDHLNNSTSFEYDQNGNLLKSTNPLGAVTSFEYDAMNRTLSTTDPEGLTTYYSYDINGRLVKTTKNDKSEYMDYNLNGNLIKYSDYNLATYYFKYDQMDRLIQITNPLGGSKHISYNHSGKITSVTDELGNTTSYSYNNGLLSHVLTPNNDSFFYDYDSCLNLTNLHVSHNFGPKQLINSFKYDPKSQLTSQISPMGLETYYKYDSTGHLIEKGVSGKPIAKYAYDPAGNLLNLERFKDSEYQSVSYKYDSLNRLIQMIDHLGVTDYQYDAIGRLISVSDYKNKTLHYSWSDSNLKKSMSYPDGSILNYSYDTNRISSLTLNDRVISYEYDATGNVTQIFPSGFKKFAKFDTLGNISELNVYDNYNSLISSLSFSYNLQGKCISKTINSQDKLSCESYRYDKMGQLIESSDLSGAFTRYSYDPLGNRLSKISNNSTTSYTFNADNQLTSISSSGENFLGHNLTSALLSYDDTGNLTSFCANSGDISLNFQFSAANKLSKVTSNLNGLISQVKYAYDGSDRRVSKTLNDLDTLHFVNDITSDFDDIISISSSHSQKLFVNFKETLLDVNDDITYINNESFAPLFLVKDDSIINPISLDIHGSPLDYTPSLPSKKAYNQDIQPMPSQLPRHNLFINPNKSSIDSSLTTSHLEPIPSFSSPAHSFTPVYSSPLTSFSGYSDELDFGLCFANARFYMPFISRFTQLDSNMGDLTNPLSLNYYIHCYNDPVNFLDLDGHVPILLSHALEVDTVVN